MSKVRMILVRGKLVGVMGMDDVFAEFYARNRGVDASLRDELLSHIKEKNFLPAPLERDYVDALIVEYQKYCEKQASGEHTRTAQVTYQGIPREEVLWSPTIKEDLCDGCKICFDFCPHGVFEWDESTNLPIVKYPFNCIVGCSACVPRCEPGAIVFPPRSMLDTFRRT